MSFLTVVERELRVAARRKGVRRSRLFCATVGITIVSWFLLIPDFQSPRQFGEFLFLTLSLAAFFIAGLTGFIATSDCLSEEKREGTLGLLFLTDLKGRDVVIGKLVASSLGVIYGLLAILPVIAISILAGGVSGVDFSRVVVTALNVLFLSLSIGMMTSVIYHQGSHSLAAAAVIFLFLCVGLPFCLFIADELFGWKGLEHVLLFPSPGYTCALGLPATLGRTTSMSSEFFSSLAITHAIGWAFLVFAMVRISGSWQDRSQRGAEKSTEDRLRPRAQRSARVRFRRALIEINPYLWRAARPHYRPWVVGLVLFVAFAIFGWGWIFRPQHFRDFGSYVFMAFMLNTLLKLWVATEAPGPLAADRQSGALELLLVTPLETDEIAKGSRQALWHSFAWPVLSVLILTGLFVLTILTGHLRYSTDGDMLAWMLVIGMIMLGLDCVTLGRLGNARALHAKTESRAVITSVFVVMVLPWLLYFAVISGIGLLYTLGARLRVLDSWEFPLALWLFIGLTVDLLALRYYNRVLPNELRQIASARYDSR